MTHHLFAALDQEWQHINRSPASRQRLATWTKTEPALAGYATVHDVIARCHHRDDPERSDQVLAALARLSPTDAEAARLLLQALAPALKNIARAYRWLGGDEADAAVIAAAWERIRTYPATRPQRIAANITYDVRKQLAKQAHRANNEATAIDQLTVSSPEPTPEEQRLRQLNDAVRRATLTPEEATLIASTRIGESSLGRTWAGTKLRAERDRAEARLEGRR